MINRFGFLMLFLTVTGFVMFTAFAENSDSHAGPSENNGSSHKKRVEKENLDKKPPPKNDDGCTAALFPDEFRKIDGTQNNCLHPTWGSAPIELLRSTRIGYADDQHTPSGDNRPNVRVISNTVAHQGEEDISYRRGTKYSDFVWQWGQFLDHDLDLTPIVDPIEPFDIEVPSGDRYFDPEATGDQMIPFERSLYTTVDGVREQVNHITAFIDASNVYGSDSERAQALRTLDGTGKLKQAPEGYCRLTRRAFLTQPQVMLIHRPSFSPGIFAPTNKLASRRCIRSSSGNIIIGQIVCAKRNLRLLVMKSTNGPGPWWPEKCNTSPTMNSFLYCWGKER